MFYSSTLIRVISKCDAPGITISALSFAIAASMQQNFRYPSSGRSASAAAFSAHGFHTTVEGLPDFSIRIVHKE